METATRRREKESEDLQNNRPKSLCINLSQILPLFLVLLSGKWLQSGRHKAMGSPLLREYDIKVSLFSFLLYLPFHFFLFLLNSCVYFYMFVDIFLHFALSILVYVSTCNTYSVLQLCFLVSLSMFLDVLLASKAFLC